MRLMLFTTTILLGAALLFVVQPMVAKMVLPRLGGSASVWVACMLFFQTLLLLGYAYVDTLTRRLRPRGQFLVHLAVVAAAALALPIRLPAGWESPGTPRSLALPAGAHRGPPFFVLANTGPLLQAWFARAGQLDVGDPISSGQQPGELGPPHYPCSSPSPACGGLASQSGLVRGLRSLCRGGAGWRLLVWRGHATPPRPRTPAAPSLRQGLLMPLAFVPASVLLGATQSMSSEIAPVPLLWVLPLAPYLLSFVLAFRPRRRVPEAFWRAALVVSAAAVVAYLWAEDQPSLGWLVAMHLATVFTTGRVLHGRLSAERPPSAHLTTFYLWIALGGVLGGSSTLVAPQLFDTILEYPLLALACAVGAVPPPPTARRRVLDLVLPLALAGAGRARGLLLGAGDRLIGLIVRP
jgi:hypothetical protein